MKKEYSKPKVESTEFTLVDRIAGLSSGGTMGGVGTETGGDSTDWNDE